MGILTDCRLGFCAEKMRRATGLSMVGEIRALDQRVGRLEAVTVFDTRIPRGAIINGDQTVDFDADGRLGFASSDASVGISRSPWGRKHQIDLTVANPGCTDAWGERCHNDGVSISPSGCGTADGIVGESSATVLRPYTYGQVGPPAMSGIVCIVTPSNTTTDYINSFTVRADDGTVRRVPCSESIGSAGAPVFGCGP